MKIALGAIALAASFLFSGSAMAVATTVVASDDFAQGSTGFTGAWNLSTGTTIASEGLQFTKDSDTAAVRTLATAITGAVTFRFDFSYTGVDLSKNDFLALYVGGSAVGAGPNIGLKADTNSGTGAFVRTATAKEQYAAGDQMVQNTTYVVFGYLTKTGGSATYNNFALWLDPTAEEMASLTHADATATNPSTVSSFSSIGFRTAFMPVANQTLRIDNLQVSLVPEPASIALFGAALLGMGALRRRRG